MLSSTSCTAAVDQFEPLLKVAEEGIGSSSESTAMICRTMIACTRALCCELSALRQVVDSIDADLSSMECKMDQS